MFSRIFSEFLLEQGLVSEDKLREALEYQKSVRVKMGLIAVSEKLMTKEQAERVNRKQATEDKRFGDIAVEQGYLTESQVERLLKLQGNPYLIFVQAMAEKEAMSMDGIENALEMYQRVKGFTSTDIEDFKSGDVERIVPIFVRSGNKYAAGLAGVAIRTIIRLIDSDIGIGTSYEAEAYEFENIALQEVFGDHNLLLGMAGEGNNLLTIANPFAKEEFEEMDLYSFDSVCEFINCINGLYASALSREGVIVDMIPPMFYQAGRMTAEDKMLIIPVYIKNRKVRIVIAADTSVRVEA